MRDKNNDYDTTLLIKRMSVTIFLIVSWAILHVFIGVYLAWGFYGDSPTLYNFIYYIFLAATTYLLIHLLIKRWRHSDIK